MIFSLNNPSQITGKQPLFLLLLSYFPACVISSLAVFVSLSLPDLFFHSLPSLCLSLSVSLLSFLGMFANWSFRKEFGVESHVTSWNVITSQICVLWICIDVLSICIGVLSICVLCFMVSGACQFVLGSLLGVAICPPVCDSVNLSAFIFSTRCIFKKTKQKNIVCIGFFKYAFGQCLIFQCTHFISCIYVPLILSW